MMLLGKLKIQVLIERPELSQVLKSSTELFFNGFTLQVTILQGQTPVEFLGA
jgi:hypothetical protein